LTLCSGVASSSSSEESEGMYSGTSSVPKISSGSRSRLKEQKEVSREIANKSKKQIERKPTLEWYASLMECFLP
jgi:hypothetical protein